MAPWGAMTAIFISISLHFSGKLFTKIGKPSFDA
jgi:hypothetical protein